MAEYFEHFCHDHALILTPKEQINIGGDTKVSCYACHKPVSEPAYSCSIDCGSRIILHRRCAELPRLVEHPLLPGRLLTLTVHEHGNEIDMHWCHVCGKRFEGFAYHGSLSKEFEFDISISCGCFNYLLEEQRLIQHPSHQHPLTFVRKPYSLFHCDGCGAQDWDLAYVCNFCEFWIHKSCALLPTTFENVSHHPHPLSLSYFLPHVYRRFRFNCDVCHDQIYPTYWVYYCAPCRFLAHVKCATQRAGNVAGGSNSNTEHEDGSLIQLPVNDVLMDLIVPFLFRQKGRIVLPEINDTLLTTISSATKPQSFNHDHHRHPLTLVILSDKDAAAAAANDDDGEQKRKQINNNDDDEEELTLCDGCITPIVKSCTPHMYYSCDKCKFFLHLSCYELPSELEHHHKKGHKLSLSVKGVWSWSYCYFCFHNTNGLFYRCEDCQFTIDVKCASVPQVIKHAACQHHKLIGRYVNEGEVLECDACHYRISDIHWYVYSSENCGFNLHYSCAMLPASVRHRWDKHPLALSYPPYSHHPDDFYCEICEEEIHPKAWMYHCRQCDQSFHPTCLSTCGYYRNIKFGQQLVLGNCHRADHPLTYVLVTLKHRCNLCPFEVYGKDGFECASCYFACCMLCAGIDVLK